MTHPKTQWRMPTRSIKRVNGGLRPAYWLKLPHRSPLPEWHASSNAASTTGQSHMLTRMARRRHPEFTAAECLVRNRAVRRASFGVRSPNGAKDDSPGQAPSPRGASPWVNRQQRHASPAGARQALGRTRCSDRLAASLAPLGLKAPNQKRQPTPGERLG